MPSLKRKKRTFTLIEVLVAIGLATLCAFFLLHYLQAHICKQKEASLKLTQVSSMQEATVTFFERLYTKQIDWQMIQETKPYEFALKNDHWRAKCEFSLENSDTKIIADVMHVQAKISLLFHDKPIEKSEAILYFCCERQGSTNGNANEKK